ncbi:hypothetical protein BH09PSE4_BH09PSE4_06800 [soil metagenome]
MRKAALFLAFALLATTPAYAGPAEDATAAVTKVLDQFNGGDIDAFFAAHRDGAIIIDEFAPYVWTGSGSVQHWAGDYMKDAAARGISEGHMDHGAPLQANSVGTGAYIVLPTTYRFLQKGVKMAAKGSMTFVMERVGTDWKIASWTYSGPTPTPE